MAELLSLIDGNSLIHRAYHALPPLTTSKGELTNAVYGFSTMLLKVLEELKPTMMAVAFDLAAPTFRHKAFQAYKAQRQKTAEGLAAQFERTREVVRAFAFPIYEVEGFEADDVIGSLAHQADLHGIDTVIVTGDLDALQLVGPRVRVLTTRRGITDTMLYDEQAVQERYGLSAVQIVDYKAIVGDVSDNIPGLPGIGEKTAARLLQQFDSLDNIYKNLALIPQKIASTLEQGRQQAFLNRQLVTIVTDMDVTLDTEACRVGREDRRKLVALFRELEFKSLLARLSPEAGVKAESQGALWATPQATAPAATRGASGDVRRIALVNEEALSDLAERLRRQEAFSLVAIIDDTNAMRSQLVGLATAWGPDGGHYIPIGHQAGQQVALAAMQRALGPLFGDSAIRKYTHHGKLATIALAQRGIPLEGIAFDSMIAAYLLESTQRTSALPDLAATRLGLEVPSLEALVGRGKGQISPSALAVEQIAPLAVAHAEAIWRLAEPMADDLKGAGLWNLFVDIELPLIGVLAKMEQAGMAVDLSLLQTISSELYEKIVTLERQIYEHAGHLFNINSPQQLAALLFRELGLPGGKRTKTGWST
ncbi:MAG: DNA polymerase I, partial [Chloroflexi bacterium]|nr:DNA polymerase I [Chloroflexota bacterium]